VAAYRFVTGLAGLGTDTMTIPDYVALAIMILLILWALTSLRHRKFEL
jgi:hypothetical protein